ncbi:MAG: Ig-like domain-containing protein [Planctomycetota bacterium]|nr:Ig-like domain-containing protein [Planctomycetota bacterium]
MERPRKNHQCMFEIQDAQLERRDVPASNLGNTFAIVPGEITKAGDPAVIQVKLTSDLFTLPKGKATLGVAVAATTASTVQPMISKVVNGSNKSVIQPPDHTGGKAVKAAVITTKAATPSLLNVQLGRGQKSSSYTVSVKDKASTTGNFLSGFYLPGDANGDLKVDKTDLAAIKSLMGVKVGDTKYSFNADSNRDGIIDNADMKLSQGNQGVAVKVTPMITARLDPASDTGTADRITDVRSVKFQGVATPGSTVTYTEVDSKTPPVSTQADATGNYTVTASLADGSNLFRVNATDAFGQTISGLLAPVTYQANPPGKV